MSDNNVRINKVLRELNISLKTACDFLKSKNIIKQENPHFTQMRIFVKYHLVVNL